MSECPNVAGHHCSMSPCSGASKPAVCNHLAKLAAWRSLSNEEQAGKLEASRPTFDFTHHLSIKLLILGCDYRGDPALECGCTSTRICLMGKGRPIPESSLTDVTDKDCQRCVKGEI